MASLTVRQLDEKLKKQLRLRAAKNGRSVEDEVRTILRSAAADTDTFVPAPNAKGKTERGAATDARRVEGWCKRIRVGGGAAQDGAHLILDRTAVLGRA